MTLVLDIPTPPTPSVEQLEEMKNIKTRKPREQKHDFKDGCGRVPAHRHINGKGWIAKTAVVEDSVYVGPRAEVYNNAYVSGNVRLEGRAKVFGTASISGDVIIKQSGMVYGRAVVRDQTLVADHSRITGSAHVSGQSRLFGASTVQDSAQIISTTLRDNVSVQNAALLIRSTVVGRVVLRANCVVINSILDGNIIVDGFGQVLSGSNLRNSRSDASQAIHVTDHAIIADNTQVWVPVTFRQHAVLARCHIAAYYHDGTDSERPVVGGNVVMHHRRFGTRAELMQFLEVASQQPATSRPQNNQPHATQPMPNSPRQNYLETTSGPRRVQRLQEVPT